MAGLGSPPGSPSGSPSQQHLSPPPPQPLSPALVPTAHHLTTGEVSNPPLPNTYLTQIVSIVPLILYDTRSRQIWHVQGTISPPVVNLTPAERSAQLTQLRTCGPKRSFEAEEMVKGLQILQEDIGGETTVVARDSEKGREMERYFLEKRGVITAILDQDRMAWITIFLGKDSQTSTS